MRPSDGLGVLGSQDWFGRYGADLEPPANPAQWCGTEVGSKYLGDKRKSGQDFSEIWCHIAEYLIAD